VWKNTSRMQSFTVSLTMEGKETVMEEFPWQHTWNLSVPHFPMSQLVAEEQLYLHRDEDNDYKAINSICFHLSFF
jgi:hypothetical protein